MNLSSNFTKFVFAGGIGVFLMACNTAPPQPPPPPPPSAQNSAQPTSTPLAKQMPPTSKPMPPLISSHGAQSGDNSSANLSWQLVDASSKTLADYRGKAVVLDFWATYCPPCEEEIPHLVELSGAHKTDLQVVGLHVGGPEDKPNIAGFVQKYKIKYDLGYPEQALMDFYLQGDDRIPQTLVFDRHGNLVQKFVGFTPEIKTELDNAVQTALAQ